MSALSALRNVLAGPPTFVCRECRRRYPRTVFDAPEADGSIVCAGCEATIAQQQRGDNPVPWWDTDDRAADVPARFYDAEGMLG